MSLTIPAGLQARLAADVACLQVLLTIVRRDGVTIRLTSHEEDLTVDGQAYLAGSLVERTEMETRDGMAPPTGEYLIHFGTEVTLADVRAGLFDDASFRLALCDGLEPALGQVVLRAGRIGGIELTDARVARMELRGLAALLEQEVMPVIQVPCPRSLGDEGCGVPVDPPVRGDSTAYAAGAFVKVATGGGAGHAAYEDRIFECTTAGTTDASPPVFDTTVGNTTTDGTVVWTAREAWTRAATVATAGDAWGFTVTVSEARAASDDTWFRGGLLVVESGPAAGAAREIHDWDSATGAVLFLEPLPAAPEAGDRLRLTAACDKSLATCRDRFANVAAHLGHPYVPGSDWMTRVEPE